MANIFDGINNAAKQNRQALIELTATYEAYRPLTIVKVAFRWLGNLFKKLFHKEYLPAKLSYEYDGYRYKLSFGSNDDMLLKLRKYISNALSYTGKISDKNSDDRLSVKTIETLSKLYKNDKYPLMSPAEKADVLKRKCRGRKLTKIRRSLSLWLSFSILIIAGAVSGLVLSSDQWLYIGIAAVSMEFINWYICRRRLAYEKLARTLSFSGEYLGGIFSVPVDELTIRRFANERGGKYEMGLRALHSLRFRMASTSQKIVETNEIRTEALNNKNEITTSLRNYKKTENTEALDTKDLNIMTEELKSEYSRLDQEIKQCDAAISGLNKKISEDSGYCDKLKACLMPVIMQYWNSVYNTISFDGNFYSNIIDYFEWHAYETIEKRLIELKNTKDPAALGKMTKGDGYSFPFGVNGNKCNVFFRISGQPPHLDIRGLDRSTPLTEIEMSDKEVEDVLSDFGLLEREIAFTSLTEALRQRDVYITECEDVIKKEKEKLEEAKNAYSNLIEINGSLGISIKTKEIEIRNLQKLLQEARNKLDHEQNSENKDQQQIDFLTNTISGLLEQIEQIKREKIEIEKKKKDIEADLVEKEKEIYEIKVKKTKLQKDLDNITKEYNIMIEETKNNINSLQNTINLNQGVLKNLSNKSMKNSSSLKTANKSVEDGKKMLADLRHKVDELENIISAYKEEKERLDRENEKLYSQLEETKSVTAVSEKDYNEQKEILDSVNLYDNVDTVKTFAAAFKTAEKEIDIMSPWVSDFINDNKMRIAELFEGALKRGVKIKIAYGMSGDRISDNDVVKYIHMNKNDFKHKKGNYYNHDDVRKQKTIRNMYTLHRKFKNLYSGRLLSNHLGTHGKVMIVDDKYYMIGSFNLLSAPEMRSIEYFENDDRWRMENAIDHKETMLYDKNPKIIKSLINEYFKFETSSPSAIEKDLGEPG
ncbi:MAG: hypothetical protein K6E85_10360 [Lachnospiraceae bacterium]|nr:hypothetical protein [Lachnospiraceae bacterium]